MINDKGLEGIPDTEGTYPVIEIVHPIHDEVFVSVNGSEPKSVTEICNTILKECGDANEKK